MKIKVNYKEIAVCLLIIALVAAVLALTLNAWYVAALVALYAGGSVIVFTANYLKVEILR